MPYTPDHKKRALTRLNRIKGQADALERAILAGAECHLLLQQIAALRGAAGGLMAEVLESHLRDTFGHHAETPKPTSPGDLDGVMKILRTYLK